jgi:hypothetical protein
MAQTGLVKLGRAEHLLNTSVASGLSCGSRAPSR